MKKEIVLFQLAECKRDADTNGPEERETMAVRIIEVLLTYINDPHVRKAVDAIQF